MTTAKKEQVTKMTKGDLKDVWPFPSKLSIVWAEAQRPLRRRKVQAIADELDPAMFGKLTITELVNGHHHVIDGQHRLAAFREVFGDAQRVPCTMVVGVRDPKRAAEIWLGLNTLSTTPSAVERFRVHVTAGHETECAINELIESLGFRVDQSPSVTRPTIAAVQACIDVHKKGGIIGLRETLTLLIAMWGKADRTAYSSYFISGVARFLQHSDEATDLERLVNKVTQTYTPARLIGAARGSRELMRGSMAVNIARVLVQEYNKGLRETKRLSMP